METSLKQFRHELTEAVLNFVWQEWASLGVLASSGSAGPWIIDPEPLLLFTLEVARRDVRIFDEVLDWLYRNDRWIHVQRLSRIAREDGVGLPNVLGAVAATLAEKTTAMKWRLVAAAFRPEKKSPPQPLFWVEDRPLTATITEPDPVFLEYGFIRGPTETRGLSRSIPMRNPTNLIIKARSLFGVGMRADILVYLMTHESGHPSMIAGTLGFSQKRVQDTLVELAESGLVFVRPMGRSKIYWLRQEEWWNFLVGLSQPLPKWIDWRALVRGLTTLWRAVWDLKEEGLTDYVFSSVMRQAMRAAQNDLYASGIGFEIEDDRAHLAESYAPVFLQNMKKILGTK